MDKSTGAFSGTGQGGCCKFPVNGVASGDAVTLTTGPYEPLNSYSATFKGTLSADGKTLSGSWDDSGVGEGTFTATRTAAPPPDSGPPDSPDTPSGPSGNGVKLIPGDVYVSDVGANVNTGAVYKVNPENGVATLVHQGAPFAGIRDIALGPGGGLYVADLGANAIHRIDLKTGNVTRLTAPADPLMFNPWGIAYDPTLGDLLVTTAFGNLLRVDPKTGVVKKLLQNGDIRPRGLTVALGQGAFTAALNLQGVLRIYDSGGWKSSLVQKGFPAPYGLAISATSAGNRFFLSDASPQEGGIYSWLDKGKSELIVDDALIGTPTGLGLSADGKTLYIGSATTAGRGALIAMNVADHKVRTVAGGFATPESIAVAPPTKVTVQVGVGKGGTQATPSGVTTTVTSAGQPVLAAVGVSVGLPRGVFARASKAVRVKAVTATVPAGTKKKIKLRFPGKLGSQIRAALRAGKKVKAKVTVKATAASGASRKLVKQIPIKR